MGRRGDTGSDDATLPEDKEAKGEGGRGLEGRKEGWTVERMGRREEGTNGGEDEREVSVGKFSCDEIGEIEISGVRDG